MDRGTSDTRMSVCSADTPVFGFERQSNPTFSFCWLCYPGGRHRQSLRGSEDAQPADPLPASQRVPTSGGGVRPPRPGIRPTN
jgi:hypothetical protein